MSNLLVLLIFFSLFIANIANDYRHSLVSQQNGINNLYHENENHYHGLQFLNDLDRDLFVNYWTDVLFKVVGANDRLAGHQVTSKYNYFASHADLEETAASIIEQLFAKLRSKGFVIRNTTLAIAMMYIDRVGQTLKVFPNHCTLRRLLASCLIIASKKHGEDEESTDRNFIADLFDIPIQDLYDTEMIILNECVKDYSIHPQALMSLIRPLLNYAQPF
jgi:hypothetical protein